VEVDGEPSSDPRCWERAFRGLYSSLYTDPHNGPDVRERRLEILREHAASEDQLHVPLCLVKECMARAVRKQGTAPGLDGVTWAALSVLPHRAVVLLRDAFEQRINTCAGSVGVVEPWREVLLHLIPKTPRASKPGEFRPIALSSVLQKLYLSVVTTMCEHIGRTPDVSQCGFRAGHQTAEIADFTRLLVRKCAEYAEPIAILKIDLHRAFDTILHGHAVESLLRADIPCRLVHAVAQEFECLGTLSFQGQTWSNVEYSKGGRQGGSDTPFVWVRVLDVAIRRAKQRFRAEDLGYRFVRDDVWSESFVWEDEAQDAHHVPVMAWADDLLIFARGEAELERMWHILTEEIGELALSWKPSSFELLLGGPLRIAEEGSRTWVHAHEGGELKYHIKAGTSMNVLGVHVSNVGCDLAALEYRLSQGWVHYSSRKNILNSRHIALRLRWNKVAETVYRTVLHGIGSLSFTQAVLSKLDTFETKILCSTLNVSRRSDEFVCEFWRRAHATVAKYKEQFGWVSLRTLALNTFCGWHGHVLRMPHNAPLHIVSHWRSAMDVRQLPRAKRPRRDTAGRPPVDPAETLEAAYGPFWRNLAQNRSEWREAKRVFLYSQGLLPQLHGRGWDFGMLAHISHKLADMLMNTRMNRHVPLMQLCDNELVVKAVTGEAVLSSTSPHAFVVRKMRWHFYAFEYRWRCESFCSDAPFILHIPRELNKSADMLCNLLLDEKLVVSEHIEVVQLPLGVPVALYSDGASRGNPGPAACAAIVQVFLEDSWRTVAFSAVSLGISSSVCAEFEGACLAQELFVRFCVSCGIAL
jgi:hypothetical protein